jgi:hypothetical protein
MAATQFTLPSSTTILNSMLQTYVALMTANGYPQVMPDPGSEVYVRFLAIAQQQAVMYNILQQQIDARLVDTATGDDLDRVLNQYGLQRKPSTSSEGFIQLISTASQTLVVGMLLSSTNSLQYQVATSGVYAPNANVPVISVDQGSDTNLGIGIILTWENPLPLMQTTSPVSVALTGGSDQETDAQARTRLIETIQNPPQAGNAQQMINLSTSVDPLVQAGFLYSNYAGAGTQLIALVGYQTDGYYIGRDIPHLLSDNIALGSGGDTSPYNAFSVNYGNNLANDASIIYGTLPAGVANPWATVVTTVNNIASSLTFLLNLPNPIGSPVNGVGGGWLNYSGYTWPNPDGTYVSNNCQVTAVTDSLHITVQAASVAHSNNKTTYPIAGQTLINWINRSGVANNGWQIVTAKVLVATDNGNDTWSITLDTPLTTGGVADYYGNLQVAIGDYIFPASVNAQNYLDTVMLSFANLGPGQVTSLIGLQAIGANRQPSASAGFSYYVDGQFTQALSANNPEIYSAQYLYNSTGANAPTPTTPPQIYIPQNIAFYNSTPQGN